MAQRGNSEQSSMDIKAEDILTSVQILGTMSPEAVQLNAGTFLRRKLYTGTRLEGNENEADEASVGHILKKNIYYLARITRNVTMLTIQMTQKGILTLDEKDAIVSCPKYLIGT